MTTTEQGTERPITGRPAGAVAAALVVVLVNGSLSAALWLTSSEAVPWVMGGSFLVFAVIGLVSLAVRDTFWMGVGMLAGAVIVAAAGLVAFMMLADAFA